MSKIVIRNVTIRRLITRKTFYLYNYIVLVEKSDFGFKCLLILFQIIFLFFKFIVKAYPNKVQQNKNLMIKQEIVIKKLKYYSRITLITRT